MLALFYGWNNVDVPGLDRSHWERHALFDKVSALPKRSIEEVERNVQTNLPAAEDKRPHRRDLVVRRFQRPADWRALIDSRYSYREPKKAIEIYKRVMVYAAYMLGHIDGIAGEVAALVPKAMDALERQPYFKPFFSRLCDELRAMYGTYGQWKGLEIYDPLKQLADELLKAGGIDIQARADDGAYVHIPFSAETLPTLEEQMAFLTAKNSGGPK